MTTADDRATCESDDEPAAEPAPDEFEGVPDGAGCTEIWEYLSERRGAAPPADD